MNAPVFLKSLKREPSFKNLLLRNAWKNKKLKDVPTDLVRWSNFVSPLIGAFSFQIYPWFTVLDSPFFQIIFLEMFCNQTECLINTIAKRKISYIFLVYKSMFN